MAKEIIRNNADKRVLIGLDYFDASINRIAAWVTGQRAMEKALLFALLCPSDEMKALQDSANFSKLMVLNEEIKTLPFGEIWDEYCRRQNVEVGMDWFEKVEKYEEKVLNTRK